jgi:hypothetical protein
MPEGPAPLDDASRPEEVARLQEAIRRDREEAEALAHWSWLREHSLEHVLRQCMSRGDEVAVTVAGGRTFHGEVAHIGGDLAVIETTAVLADVNLGAAAPPVVRVVRRATVGGRGRAKEVQSFRRRLEEYEAVAQDRQAPRTMRQRARDALLEFGSPQLPPGLLGEIRAVGPDIVYLVAQDDSEWYVPLRVLTYVARAPRTPLSGPSAVL